jgi:hypothetical protein
LALWHVFAKIYRGMPKKHVCDENSRSTHE